MSNITVVYIHGANATSSSFNFIRELIHPASEVVLDYKSADGFMNNLAVMLGKLKDAQRIFFVAHSLGGLYALHLADAMPDRVIGAFTMSSPYAGSNAARMLRVLLPAYHPQLMRDIVPGSPVIKQTQAIPVRHPWTAIVTTGGRSALMPEPNDGVVTERSMACRDDMLRIYMPTNHFEVLLDHRTVALLREAVHPHLPLIHTE